MFDRIARWQGRIGARRWPVRTVGALALIAPGGDPRGSTCPARWARTGWSASGISEINRRGGP